MPVPIEVLVGSGGLAVFAVWVVNQLWKSHVASDKREQDRADAAEASLRLLVADLQAALKKADPK